MEDHIMDAENADKLEKESRYSKVSREELLAEIPEEMICIDIGSGTGFFTDDIAVKAEKVYAVDFQEQMHEYYRSKGLPENVETVVSKASELETEDADVICSIFSLHEIELEKSLKRFREILKDDGKIIVYDWSKNAETDDIPPREKLFTAEEASEKFSEYFNMKTSGERYDTFKLVAEK